MGSPPDKALRAQALGALRELLAGFEHAHRLSDGALLRGQEESVHAALVAVLLRLCFVYHAEDRGLLPMASEVYATSYSLSGLHARLRAEARRDGRVQDGRYGAWAQLIGLFRAIHGGSPPGSEPALPPRGGFLFDPGAFPFLEGRSARRRRDGRMNLPEIPDSAVLRTLDCLAMAGGEPLHYRTLDVEHLGTVYEGLLGFEVRAVSGSLALEPTEDRRRLGAHYTSRALVRVMVERTMAPLLDREVAPEAIASLKVCDPAMGSGAFLIEACRGLGAHIVKAWERTGTTPPAPGEDVAVLARRLVARHCLYGVDKNPVAADLARLSLWLETAARDEPFTFLDHAVRTGDSLPFQWERELPEVFADGGGFDAVLGNPPWVSYAGRAAQPLAGDVRAFYMKSPAFHGYRNLQALFVHLAARVLRPGGRLGLVLPTSMSDLRGYEPSRRAHDALCLCDDELPDFGDAFDDVFQPSMGLLSTRRASPASLAMAGPWPLERRDLDPVTRALLDKLDGFPRLPPRLFGERGFQTSGEDVRKLHALAAPEGAVATPVRVGGDVEAYRRRPARLHCDPSVFGGRFRPAEEWTAVKLLIRQTARFPMVALSDGAAFRNSVLAGFADETWSAPFLLAYLNSTPVRWYHYMRHRDARQGMPQLKIAHLRAMPMPPREAPAAAHVERMGRELGERNEGVTAAERELVDGLVAELLGLLAEHLVHMRAGLPAL